MEPISQFPAYVRRRRQFSTWVHEVCEEIVENKMLIEGLQKHSDYMMQVINLTPDVKFSSIFADIHSLLSNYNYILIEINCKLEVLLSKQIRQLNNLCVTNYSIPIEPFEWNSYERVGQNSAQIVHSVNKKTAPETHGVSPAQNNNSDNSSCSQTRHSQKDLQKNIDNVKLVPTQKKESQRVLNAGNTEKNEKAQKGLSKQGVEGKNGTQTASTSTKKKKKKKKNKSASVLPKDGKQKEKSQKVLNTGHTDKCKKAQKGLSKQDVEGKNGTQTASTTSKKKKKKKNKSASVLPEDKTEVNIKIKHMDSNKKVCSEVKQTANTSNNFTIKPDLVVPIKANEQNVEKVNKVIENVKLSSNIKYEGLITHVVTPLEFYTYFVTQNKEQFDACMKELESYCETNKFATSKPRDKTIESRKKSVSIALGDYALLYLQPVLHRVKIMNWNLTTKDDLVCVNLIDIGVTNNVSLYSLHPIPENLMKYPAFATRCHLVGVSKESSRLIKNTEIFRNWIDETETVTVQVYECDSQAPDSIPVVIYDDSRSSCINELITCNTEEDPKLKELLEGWDPMSEAYKSNMNMYEFDVEDPAASIYGYVGSDYRRICKLYGKTGKCFKKACRKEHVLLDPKGFTTDKEEVYVGAHNSLKIPKEKFLNVRVTHIEGPASFYCVLDNPVCDTTEETLASLQFYMNQSENISEMKKMLTPPAMGQVVLAKFPKDKTWSRARVVSVLPEKDECTIFYVDHGSTANINFSCIRAIEPRYLHLPFQAIFCEICGIGDQWETTSLTVKYLEENLTGVSRVEIVSMLPGGQPHLLVNLFTSKGENVAEKLLIQKLVVRKNLIHLDETKNYLPG